MVIKNIFGEAIEIPFESLNGIHLKEYSFHRCPLANMSICNTFVQDCDFRNATMNHMLMDGSTIENSKFILMEVYDSSFVKCNLQNQYITSCKFVNVDFTGADFRDALLRDNEFVNCNFSGANLMCQDIVECRFENTIYDDNTCWRGYWGAAEIIK